MTVVSRDTPEIGSLVSCSLAPRGGPVIPRYRHWRVRPEQGRRVGSFRPEQLIGTQYVIPNGKAGYER